MLRGGGGDPTPYQLKYKEDRETVNEIEDKLDEDLDLVFKSIQTNLKYCVWRKSCKRCSQS